MALDTYTNLQASIANWLHRSDMAALIPDLIELAEGRINGDLDARLQDTMATLTATSGVASVAAPTDMNNIRSLVVLSNPNQVLEYMTPDQFNVQYATDETNTPRAYCFIGASIYLGPTPDANYNLQCTYKALLPPLAAAASGTTWLLTQYPLVYLYAALCESVMFTKDMAMQQAWELKYKEAIEAVNAIDWANGGTMRVKTDVRM
jgi:hypothetical protein